MSETPGVICFGSISDPNCWDIGEPKKLVFSSPSEAKRGEQLFTAMQRELAAREESLRYVRKTLDAARPGMDEQAPIEAIARKVAAALAALEAERDAAVKDAVRYRWLSEQSMIEDGEAEVLLLDLNEDGSSECYYKYHGIALDAAIDAAIAAKGER